MEIGIIEAAIGLAAGTSGAFFAWKQAEAKAEELREKIKKLEADMVCKPNCDLRHQSQADKCGMLHQNVDRTLQKIDDRFDQLADKIDQLREERKDDLQKITDLIRSTLISSNGGK